jgi:Peptidase M10 serralysin C terminal/Proprotein convertase P-domain/RTX calcium-binding nonapeptide repeat (4 copies)
MLKPSQLAATIISPAGTSLLLFDRPLTQGLNADTNEPEGPENAWPGIFTIGIASFMGENAQGTWTLQLRDVVSGDVAEFKSLTVRAWGHADGPQNQYVFTDEFTGTKTLTDAAGIDTVNAAAVSTAVNLSLAAQGSSTIGSGGFTLAAGTVIENATGGAGNDTLTGNDLANTLRGNDGNDTLAGGDGFDVIAGGSGSDSLDGGEGIVDIVDYRGAGAVTLSLLAGTATQGSDSDTLAGFEAVFASSAADTLRGRDGAEQPRSDTLRGGGGNDTIDGGAGVDMAEHLGAREGYTVTRTENGFTVVDTDPANGDDGSDTLLNVERLIFADRMLAFGTRAEELARVAFVLWTPGIVGSGALFSRGYSYYDNGGYDFSTMCGAALTFHTEQGVDYARKLVANMPGQSRTEAEILTIMADAGGGEAGRIAALIAVANDAATEAAIAASNIRVNGVVAELFVPGFGNLFGLLPG